MNVESDTPLSLCAALAVDPIQLPAAFITEKGRIFYTNVKWQAWSSPSANDTRSPSDAILAAAVKSAMPAFAQIGNRAFATVRLDCGTVLQLCRFQGREKWMRGFIATLLRQFGTLPDQDAQRYEHICGCKHLGLWEFNLNTGARYTSAGWALLRGYSSSNPPDPAHDAWLSRLHPRDRENAKRSREMLARGDCNEVFDEYRERHANGQWIWVMSQVSVLEKNSDGSPARFIGIDTNVSHLRMGTEAQEDLSRRLQLAASASDIGIWEYDIEKKEVKWDQRTRAFYEVNESRLVYPGSFWEGFLHPEDKEEVLAVSNKALEEITDSDIKFRIVLPDKSERYLRSRATHVPDNNGRQMLLGITWDITAEAKQAAEIKSAYSLLKERNSALEEVHAQLEYRSNHDALTGLANRHRLQQFQQKAFSGSEDAPIRCAVMQMDVDRFKAINDTLGHGAGDAVLRHVAELLRAAAPPGALVARVGGDEFAVFLPDAPANPILGHWANGLIEQSENPFEYEGHSCRFSISIGIAAGFFTQEEAHKLFTNADLALYEAKRAGRRVARFYSDGLELAAQEKRQASDDILSAFGTGQFQCHYQPQFDSTGVTITGIEALARWYHPTRGILSPDQFLGLAEELGVIAEIDDLVLKAALKDADVWRSAGKKVPRLFVNVSGQRLLDPLLPDRIAFLKDSPIPIGFELLETVFLDRTDPNLSSNLRYLRENDIAIDVDDFGTGHASLLSLRNLRPDRIKIDRDLVLTSITDFEQRALIGAIVDIARVMGMQTVAEGVETLGHIGVLQELGCDYLQGYGLCRPIAAEDLLAKLPAA